MRALVCPCRRRAFTLIELTVSLAISSLLLLALGSTIALASRALPANPDRAQQAAEAWAVLDRLSEDLAVCTSISIDGTNVASLVMEDLTPDGSGIKAVYWLDADGTVFREDSLGAGPVAVASGVRTLTAVPTMASTRVQRVSITWQYQAGLIEPIVRTVECLNRPVLQ